MKEYRVLIKPPASELISALPKGQRSRFVNYMLTRLMRTEVGRKWIMDFVAFVSPEVEGKMVRALEEFVNKYNVGASSDVMGDELGGLRGMRSARNGKDRSGRKGSVNLSDIYDDFLEDE